MINFSGGPLQNLRKRLTPPSRKTPLTVEEKLALKEWHDRQEAALGRFRPGEGEWLRLGLLFGLLQCCVGWTVLLVLSNVTVDVITPGDRWLRAVLMPILFLAGFYRGRWLAEWLRTEYWSVRAISILVLVLLVRFGPYLLDPALLSVDLARWTHTPSSFFEPPVWINSVLLGWFYLGGESVSRDALNLFVRPTEMTIEQGGLNNSLTTDWVERQPSYRRLKNRIAFGGFLVGVGMAVPFLLNPTAPLDHGQVFPTTLLLVLYIPTALLTLSLIRLHYLRTVWRLGDLAEPVGLGRRWLVYLVVFGVLLALVALVLPHQNPINDSGSATVRSAQVVTPKPAQTLPPQAIKPPNQPPPTTNQWKLPDWVQPLLTWTMIGLALLLLVFVLRRVNWSKFLERPLNFKIRLRWPRLLLSWQAFVAWLKSLFKRPAWDTADEEAVEGGAGRRSWFSRFARDPFPADPRAQVRYYYRQTLSRAARAGVPRQPPQTPREYATDLRQRFDSVEFDSTQGGQDAETLRALYEEARFSPHPIAPEQVEQAQGQANRLNGALRQFRKHRKESKEKDG